MRLKKGFTLIEILIVVAIMAILVSIILPGLGKAKARGRDTRRVADLKQLQQALENYLENTGRYVPGTTGLATVLSGALYPTYLSSPPGDPLNTGNYVYYYYSSLPYDIYCIGAVLEVGVPAGANPSSSCSLGPTNSIPNLYKIGS